MNPAKSKMVPMGSVHNTRGMTNILGCKVSSLPMKIPWSSAGDHLYKVKTIWDGFIEKIERRLVGWERIYLSKGEH